MENVGYDVLMWALSVLGTIITSIVLPYIVKLIAAKTKNEKWQYAIQELGETIITAVDYTNQTFVDQLKTDGKFDAENQKKALSIAMEYSMHTLADSAKKIFGKEGIDLQLLIEKRIEAYIAEKKTNK